MVNMARSWRCRNLAPCARIWELSAQLRVNMLFSRVLGQNASAWFWALSAKDNFKFLSCVVFDFLGPMGTTLYSFNFINSRLFLRIFLLSTIDTHVITLYKSFSIWILIIWVESLCLFLEEPLAWILLSSVSQTFVAIFHQAYHSPFILNWDCGAFSVFSSSFCAFPFSLFFVFFISIGSWPRHRSSLCNTDVHYWFVSSSLFCLRLNDLATSLFKVSLALLAFALIIGPPSPINACILALPSSHGGPPWSPSGCYMIGETKIVISNLRRLKIKEINYYD